VQRAAVRRRSLPYGTIPEAAKRAGLIITGADLVDRGYGDGRVEDFLASRETNDNIVCNPPFDIAARFAPHALGLTRSRWRSSSPSAAPTPHTGLRGTPLRRIRLLTPRPSMQHGHVIAAGENPAAARRTSAGWCLCWAIPEARN